MKNLILLLTVALLASCNLMEDQTILTFDREKLANPNPRDRDFAAINAQHRILIGIIDTGVDYNQPMLDDHIHFQLNSENKPIGFGVDISAEDNWAAPFIARSSDYNPNILEKERLKYAEQMVRVAEVVKENPEFEKFLNPLRNNGLEVQAGAFHGTHVAGLASYDDPKIGIIGYRVLPFNVKMLNGEPIKKDQGDVFVDQLIAGSSAAIQQGARVLNMSLTMGAEKTYEDAKKSAADIATYVARQERLRQFALANPNVVFAVAAGNDGKWIDFNARYGFPCGVDAPNIICVGATDEDGTVATFSNLLMTEGAFVLGFGVKVKSTMPLTMCNSKAVAALNGENPFKTPEAKTAIVEAIKKDCTKLAIKELSGTSMATPIIARQIAKIFIENPQLTGAEAVKTLLSRSQTYKMGRVSFPTFKVEKPSWYQEPEIIHGIILRSKPKVKEYFEFGVPPVGGKASND